MSLYFCEIATVSLHSEAIFGERIRRKNSLIAIIVGFSEK
jgi:hypothetical protein